MRSACTLIVKEAAAHSCFPVRLAESLRRPFFSNFPGRALLTIYSTHLNKDMKVRFLCTFFTEKQNKARKPSGSKTGKS